MTIVGLLGVCVAANHALDAQAQGLGEYVRAKVVEVPVELLEPDRSGIGTSLDGRTRRRPERRPAGARRHPCSPAIV